MFLLALMAAPACPKGPAPGVDSDPELAADADGDGYVSWALEQDPALADCDDEDPTVTPATERYVAAGLFFRGGGYNADTQPEREIWLSDYCVDRFEVTHAEFIGLLESQAAAGTPNQDPEGQVLYDFEDSDDEVPERIVDLGGGAYAVTPGYEDHPVTEVFAWGAELYCVSVGRRLPTEAEWEKAARGDQDHRLWPWGDQALSCERANIRPGPEGVDQNGEGVEPCVGDTTPVGSYPLGAGPYGALDQIGNVAEWVLDWYQPDYYATSADTDPRGPDSGWEGLTTPEPTEARITRGGSFATADLTDDVTFRYIEPEHATSNGVGFRCVRPLSAR